MRFSVLVFFFVLSKSVFSLGLGELTSETTLGSVYEGEIALIGVDSSYDDSHLKVKVAGFYDEKLLGRKPSPQSNNFKAKIVKPHAGAPYIGLFSKGVVSEPYVEVDIILEWPGGVLTKQFPILLDVPGMPAN